jgi:hypothetical protein
LEKGTRILGLSLGNGFCRKFYLSRFEVLAVLALVSLLGWSIVKPSAGSGNASIHRNDAVDSPFELFPLTTATTFHGVDATSRRPVYPYSIIPGGVVSAAELRSAMAQDPIVAAHYAAFDLAKARVFRLQEARSMYVSYRRGDDVFWTSKKLRLAVGETLITDGQHISRTRCGNQVSDAPRMPVSLAGDPEPQILDRPVVSQIIEPFVPPIAGEIEGGGTPAGALFFGVTSAAGSGGGTIGGAAIWAVPIIPMTGSKSSSPGSPPPISTPEPTCLILLSTGLVAACLFRKLRKT